MKKTPEQIAEIILNTFTLEARKNVRTVPASGGSLLVIHFWLDVPSFLNLLPIIQCFEILESVHWQDGADEPDSPCIVVQGAIDGTRLQAVFVLKDGILTV
jgi:hypothetical protein